MTETSLPLSLIVVLLVAHFVGDWLLQSDWMAQHKSTSVVALGAHALVYATVLAVFTVPFSEGIWSYVAFLEVNGLAHFAQDAITSRITSRLWFFRYVGGGWIRVEEKTASRADILVEPWEQRGGNRYWFFVAIGADQLLHYVTLFVTASWWLQ